MSRHRDIRSMNYSDEYEGYDDVYGHSVEDDYCVSPGVEQFLYDRNKQPNIASFMNEADIKECDEKEGESDDSSQKPALSQLNNAKLVSCIETIRNVIGDTISDAELTEKIIEFNFDTEKILDNILNTISSKNQSESKIDKEDGEERQSGSSTETFSNNIRSPSSFMTAFGSKLTSPKITPKNFNTTPNEGFLSPRILPNNDVKIPKSADTSGKIKFNSLSELIDNHRNNVSPLKKIMADRDLPNTKQDTKKFNTLAAMTAHHLQKSNDLEKIVESKPQFVIPKLLTKSSSESSIRSGAESHRKFIDRTHVNLKDPLKISQLHVESEKPTMIESNNDNWEIDLTMALRQVDVFPSTTEQKSMGRNNELGKNSNLKSMKSAYDITEIYQNTAEQIPLSLVMNTIDILKCNLNSTKLCNTKLKYTATRGSRFGMVLCRKSALPRTGIAKTIFATDIIGTVKRFDFASPSPDSIKLMPKPIVQVTSPASVKVIPARTQSAVMGFDLSGIDNVEFLHPRSQSPLTGTDSPNLQRKNDITPRKNINVSKSNSPRCRSPSSGRVTPELDGRTKNSIRDKRSAMMIYESERVNSKQQLHLVVVGHVDAGKSTLLGRLLCDLGQVSSRLIHKYQQESKKVGKQSFAYAWVLDETGEERERGITMDIGYSKFETDTKSITVLDAPGHRDFIPNMITGATQADVALLVVDATRGEFETGFESGGQTREHALLLRSLGVSQIAVIVNKLDTVNWSKERFNEIVDKMNVFLKQVGYRDTVAFVPCSGLSGQNIVEPPKAGDLSSWYTGPTLLSVIDRFKCPERPVSQPFRFSVNDIFKGTGSGFCVSGHVETGMVTLGDKVFCLPGNEIATVKGMTMDENAIKNGFAGDHLSLIISGIDQQKVGVGDIVCSPQNPIPVTTCFRAHIVVFATAMPITKGLPVVLHVQSLIEPVVITKLIKQLNKSTGEVEKHKPRCLMKNSSAIIEIATSKPICLELYKDIKQLGRIMLRLSGTTIAAGLVTKIK